MRRFSGYGEEWVMGISIGAGAEWLLNWYGGEENVPSDFVDRVGKYYSRKYPDADVEVEIVRGRGADDIEVMVWVSDGEDEYKSDDSTEWVDVAHDEVWRRDLRMR